MWKTVEYKVGEVHGLDAPNEHAIIRFVPLMWLPGATSKEVIARMQDDETATGALADSNDAAKALDVRMEGIYAILPQLVASWTLKDPETGQAMDSPKVLMQNGDISGMRRIPTQILLDVVNKAMEYGQEDEPIVAEGPDPDEGNESAKSIPFENAIVSEPLSFREAAPIR